MLSKSENLLNLLDLKNKYNNNRNLNNNDIFNNIKKQYFYISYKKEKLFNWKSNMIRNKNDNNINYNFLFSTSVRKFFINYPFIKHTNNKIYILISLFNKKKMFFLRKLIKLNKYIEYKNNNYKKILNFDKNVFINKLRSYENNNYIYNKNIINNIINIKYNKFLLKRKILTNLFINNLKFNNINLINLNYLINKIYKKKTIINIINMKYIYLDNNIFITSIINKLNDRKKGVLRIMKKALRLIKMAYLNHNFLGNISLNNKIYSHTKINEYNDIINLFKDNKYKYILKYIKNIHIIGISLETKGRLTRRMTASRSVYKLKSKGNLKNVFSSIHGLSSLLLRGLIRSNMNNTKNNSFNKNGSYGISIKTNTY